MMYDKAGGMKARLSVCSTDPSRIGKAAVLPGCNLWVQQDQANQLSESLLQALIRNAASSTFEFHRIIHGFQAILRIT